MKRLFVSDLDGTLLNKAAQLNEETVRIVNECIDKGMDFTVSTARTPATALKILKPLNLKLPITMMNGAVVYDMATGRFIKESYMEETVVMVLLGLIKTKGLSCFLYGVEDGQFVAYYDSVNSTSLNYFRNERIMKYDKKFIEVADLSLVASERILYVVLREPKEKLTDLHRELSVVKGVKYAFYPDVYNEEYYMLEIYSEDASKKTTIDELRKMGRYDSVTGFGDNLNDTPLVEACDYFYAVSNAHPEIQNMATTVIPSNEENGVAMYLQQIMSELGE
ncbi:MAG: HAD family hydrolase [Lachnospiraceae bacterium]|nr:HAD family hydrolase [Lachnospiraceae bacterium]